MQLAKYVTENQFASWQFLLFLNVILLVLGMFLEVVSIMYIVLPVVIPLLGPLGIDPVHFAIVVVVNMEIALITPPVGLNLYVLSNATGTPVSSVISGAWPYVVIGFIELAVITYWPAFTLFLPNLLMPK